MKKLVGISLFIFWAFVTAILTAGLVFYQNNKLTPTNNPVSTSGTNNPMQQQITLDITEIAKHNSTNDCWLLINNKAYNVTSYLGAHPGGVATIAPYCGKDATQAFQDQGHSSYANSLLASYYIGPLNQSVNTSQIMQNVQNTNSITPPPPSDRNGNDEENDD